MVVLVPLLGAIMVAMTAVVTGRDTFSLSHLATSSFQASCEYPLCCARPPFTPIRLFLFDSGLRHDSSNLHLMLII